MNENGENQGGGRRKIGADWQWDRRRRSAGGSAGQRGSRDRARGRDGYLAGSGDESPEGIVNNRKLETTSTEVVF